jgi:hypothetical protein
MELLDRLAALIPPPRRHRHTYAGVFAPNSKWRPLVAGTAGPEPGPDPALAIRLHHAAKEMGLGEQFGMGTDELDNSDESDRSYQSADRSDQSAQSATTNCGKIDAKIDTNCGKIDAATTGVTTSAHTPFHLEQNQDQNCRANRKANSREANRKASIMWALLMARILEVTPLVCPHCGQPMKIISFITQRR